ncbi:MAG: D-sedoheptulose 7-phosphate isomerase [Actinomycetota bacterium]|jgi:D-sedoheptulose 7-phosphate isomerase|nr:D-sedoheptulose 7-phosphate isomerase [Actinomycetota bacterium]
MSSPMPTGLTHVRALADVLVACAPQLSTTCDRWGRQLADRLPRGHRLLAAGNGGSAAQAQHLTAELVGRYRDDRPPLSAIALHADTSSVTAIVNDFGADEVFARQVLAHGRPGDVLVLMSTSGRSPNLLRAAHAGRRVGLGVWGMTGPLPNPLAEVCDEVVAVDGPSTATVQEVHLVALHLVCAALDVAMDVCPETVLQLRAREVVA